MKTKVKNISLLILFLIAALFISSFFSSCGETTEELDPFNGLKVIFEGISTEGTAIINDTNCNKIVMKYNPDGFRVFPDKDLKNGDEVEVYYDGDEEKAKEDGYSFTSTSKTFKVSGLKEAPKSVKNLDLSELNKKMREYLHLFLSNYGADYFPSLEHLAVEFEEPYYIDSTDFDYKAINEIAYYISENGNSLNNIYGTIYKVDATIKIEDKERTASLYFIVWVDKLLTDSGRVIVPDVGDDNTFSDAEYIVQSCENPDEAKDILFENKNLSVVKEKCVVEKLEYK